MKILLDDGLQLSVGTGIGSYAKALGEALATMPDVTLVREDLTPTGPRRRARLAYLKRLDSAAYRERLRDLDVVHYANYAMPKKLPPHVVSAVTVHDLAAFSHKSTLPLLYGIYNRFMIKRAMKHADIIFTVSESTKQEIAARFPKAATRTVSVHPGHHREAVCAVPPAKYENTALTGLEERKFFLFVGTLEKRKNLVELINAYLYLIKTDPTAKGFSLVLAGKRGFGYKRIKRALRSAPEGADIRLPGYISASDRQKLYAEAAAFVFPSLLEGFGSPQTEAMAAELPLILSDIPTNREISGAYGHFYPLGNVSALTALLSAAVDGKLPADKAIATQRLAQLTWEQAAKEVLAAYQRAGQQKENSQPHG
ncbi:MAG: glycosyltransferase family 4 protein [Ruminococcaceae bacterium]|nr:glycosyltransferase family 4 protein [Oscillospiraceae bacterium]